MTELSDNIDRLTAFVKGALPPDETEQLINQLIDDDEALSVVDQLWKDQLPAEGLAALADELPADQAAESRRLIENRLFRSIQRSELSNKIITFGTIGLFDVIYGFVKPLLIRADQVSSSNTENRNG